MKKDPEQVVCDMYRAYQGGRLAEDTIDDRVVRETAHNIGSEIIDQNEEQITSLYKQFQRSRTSNHEQVIERVMAVARSHAAQQSEDMNMALEFPVARPQNGVSLWRKVQLWFRFDSMGRVGGWQSATVFSVTLAIISVVSILYYSQDVNRLNVVASIPELLYEHASEAVPYIHPKLDNQFGFSSSQEPQRSAFRSGVLLVQLQMLVKANELDKLQKALVTATLFLRRTNKTELVDALNRLVENVEASSGRENRMYYVDSFEDSVQRYFTNLDVTPMLELGKWIEISLLSSQLPEVNRAVLFNQLLPQGRDIVNQARPQLSTDPAVMAFIEETLNQNGTLGASAQGAFEWQKKLERIKAALL